MMPNPAVGRAAVASPPGRRRWVCTALLLAVAFGTGGSLGPVAGAASGHDPAPTARRPQQPAIRLAQLPAPRSPPDAAQKPPPTAEKFGISPATKLAPGARAPFFRPDVDPKTRKELARKPQPRLGPTIELEIDPRQRFNLITTALTDKKARDLFIEDRKVRGLAPAFEMPSDLRLPVSGAELHALPFSAIAHIVSDFGAVSGPEQGSGFLIEPGIALTAAHVLHSPRGGPAASIDFTPGCRAAGIAQGPNRRSSIKVGAASLRVPEAWLQGNYDEEGDYGIIFLPPGHGTEACGHLVLDDVNAEFLERRARYDTPTYLVAGFPYEKAFGSLWFARGSLRSVSEHVIRHLVDTTQGQSGSPLFAVGLERATGRKIPVVLGIHSRAGFGNFNIARRIDAGLLRDLKRWKAQLGLADAPARQ